MQYQCVQCNETFTLDAGDDKPRCPKCLRQHGLRRIEAGTARPSQRTLLMPISAVVVVIAAIGGYMLYQKAHQHRPGDVPMAPVDPEALRKDVQALAGVDPGELARLFEPSDKLVDFAENTVQGAVAADAKARVIVAALQARKHKQGFVDWSRTEAREGPPLTAAEAWAAISRDGSRRQLYPLEISAIAVAALRSVGVPALVAEVYRFPDERTALDPTGRFGYHAVVVPKTPGSTQGTVFDAYGGRSTAPRAGDFKVLNDAQAVGAAYALRAVDKLNNHNDPKGGLADSDVAVKLLPSSASARGGRAAMLIATGGVESGTSELEAAAQLRNDAVRHNNLAVLALAANDENRATKEVAAALSELPDYALARVTLATVHLMRAEQDLARAELEKAEKLDPNMAVLPQVWAQLYASSGQVDLAIAKAQQAVQRHPKDPQGRLVLARVYRVAGRYDDMRKQAHAIMDATGPDERERMKAVLHAMLGPTALEESTGATDLAQAPGGDGVQAGSALADTPRPTEPGALQPSLGTPKLHLGGAASKLKLDLTP